MSLGSKKDTYIIIPVHNRKEITLDCLSSLEKVGALKKYAVVVVDDGSTDGTEDAISMRFQSILILKGTGDLWWTGAIKLGMEYAYEKGASNIIWLNDDCHLTENVFEPIVQYCLMHKVIMGVQGHKPDLPTNITFGGKVKTWKGFRLLNIAHQQIKTCDLLSGNLVCIPRKVIELVGYPDSVATPHYGGDSLYLLKAKKAGFDLFINTWHTVLDQGAQESWLYPINWLTTEGDPFQLIRLALTPQSGLNWNVWLRLNWEAYGLWGLIMFAKKYLSIILLTVLRFLPLSLRKSLVVIASPKLIRDVT